MEDLIQQLEDRALHLLLAGEDAVLNVLRAQLQRSTRAPRKLTGAGFCTYFVVASDAPRLPGNPSLDIMDLFVEMEGLQFGAGFALHVRKGLLSFFEASSYCGDWPPEVRAYKLAYVVKGGATGDKRDWEALQVELRAVEAKNGAGAE